VFGLYVCHLCWLVERRRSMSAWQAVMLICCCADEKNAAEAGDSCSSDDDGGQDEAQYRITVPLDIRLAPPPPLFATASLEATPHPLFASPSLAAVAPTRPSHPSLPAVPPQPIGQTGELLVRPLLTVSTYPVPPVNVVDQSPCLSTQLGQQQQQFMLPAVSTPQLLIRQPRCRDYDGEYV